ncbi:MAG TPA: hypothetical protein VMN56_22335 [Casimicrobiaceae bacterium]|nr:hypothetical protein [Casimicrobiaceae bacterium]
MRIPGAAVLLSAAALLAGCGGGGGGGGSAAPAPPPAVVNGPAWWNFGRDAQHAAQSGTATQSLSRIVWQTAVDMTPPYLANDVLHIHYGSPIITARNTVLLPVKIDRDSGFRIDARSGANGAALWSASSDYILPAHDWTPSYNVALSQGNRVYWPGAGGKLFYRDDADSADAVTQSVVFYGSDHYDLARAAYDASVIINTPLTIDPRGNVYFGFVVVGSVPNGLASGIARVAADGTATWVTIAAAAGSATLAKVAMNAAPALSDDLSTVYVVANTQPPAGVHASGALLALDAQTLATRSRVDLRDPATTALAWVDDNASASPSVGPDGDVYYGVLESNTPAHNFRGWLLHYDATLHTTKLPGSFGWDETVSVVPATMVPQYAGASPYLVVSKYNNYAGVGTGDGLNRMAILDPSTAQSDSISGIPVMREVLLILGPTPESTAYPGSVREWCINTAAVDAATSSVLVNSEDGKLYRWHLPTNQLTQSVRFDNGYAESYTPTAVGPDGKVYAINNATLFAVGQ